MLGGSVQACRTLVKPVIRLEMTLDDFATFCAIVRNTDRDDARIVALIAKLKGSTDDLIAAETADHPKK